MFECKSISGCVMQRFGLSGVCMAEKLNCARLCELSDPSGAAYDQAYEASMAGLKYTPPKFIKCINCPCEDFPCIAEKMQDKPCKRISPKNPELTEKVRQGSLDLYNKEHNPELIPPPSLVGEGLNFTSAIIKVGMNLLEGDGVYVEAKEYENRLNICKSCIFITGDPENPRCSHPKCGCWLNKKAALATEECPVGLWGLKESIPSLTKAATPKCGGCGQKG